MASSSVLLIVKPSLVYETAFHSLISAIYFYKALRNNFEGRTKEALIVCQTIDVFEFSKI